MTSAARMRSVEIRGFVNTSVATTHMWQSLGIFSPESPYISFIFIFLPDFQVTLYDEHCSSDSGQHSGEPAYAYCCSLCETQVSENNFCSVGTAKSKLLTAFLRIRLRSDNQDLDSEERPKGENRFYSI